jgi:RNA polymerase-binding transcription factor DksA
VNEKRDLQQVKDQLLRRKWELEEKLTSLSKEQLSDGQVQDPGDQALTSTMEALRMSLQDAEVDEYKRIISALGKIGEGLYGLCVDCGNAISEKRLQLFPDTTRCLTCQEAFEAQLGQDHNFTI